MKVKKIIIFSLLGSLIFFSGVNKVKATDDVPTTSSVTSQVVTSEQETYIQDAMENFYDEHLKNQFFEGMSLGALTMSLVSLIVVFIIKKFLRTTKESLDNTTNDNSKVLSKINTHVNSFVNVINEKDKLFDEMVRLKDKEINELKEISKEIIQELSKYTSELEKHMMTETKIDALLYSIELLASSSQHIKEGIGEKVKERIEGVK